MTDITKQQLEARRSALQAEQQELRQQVTTLRGRLADLAEQRRLALGRYDLGHDDAQQEAEQALDEAIGVEATIARIERALSEYPGRIEALNKEVTLAGHRERLRELLQLRRDEVAAFNQYEQAAINFFEAKAFFDRARTLRRTLARTLHNQAVALGLPTVTEGDFNAPDNHTVGMWLATHAQMVGERVAADFEKARRGIQQV